MEENLFENFDFDLLLLIKTLYDRTGVWYRTDLMQYDGYSEVYWEIYQDILQNQCYDEVYVDCDNNCNQVLTIKDACITGFFEKCRQYSRKKHQAIKKNPFLLELEEELQKLHLEYILEYADEEPSITLIRDEADIYEYVELIDALFDLKEFLCETNKKMERILCPMVGQGGAFKERRAA